MPVTANARKAYRADAKSNHTLLSEQERARLINAHLPPINDSPPMSKKKNQKKSHLGVRRFLKNALFVFVFAMMHGVFSLYIRLRQAWNIVRYQISSILYYHHGTPEYIRRDVAGLPKKPNHLSAVLRAEEDKRPKADLERLIDEAAELATWTACAEIPMLSIYEKTGILKKHMPRVYEAILAKFALYFGTEHPSLSVTSPHREAVSMPASMSANPAGQLRLHLISAQDGRESVVDLTRTLADMSQKGKLSPRDISMDLIDAELSEGIMPEPNLLILFSPYVELSGYPPWQIRLTEIFCLEDNESFGYQVFVKALRNFSNAQFRRGK
ncbi:hypothetical protein MY4824_000388 [Beauveria thailandica]